MLFIQNGWSIPVEITKKGSKTMKGISLWEPWASLIACGAKRYETRSWPTNYRGPLLICASKGGLLKSKLIDVIEELAYQGGLAPLIGKPLDATGENTHCRSITHKHLQFGKAVAICRLTDCKETGHMSQDEIGIDMPFGDFASGRFAWKLDDVCRLECSPSFTGRQGLFNVPLDVSRTRQFVSVLRHNTCQKELTQQWIDELLGEL
ncbi:ASCH domain-containing protein [Trichococcus shcherbakoviae]|uniref:ASCH domain-containing protein n=1 Tax=Trichococcus shcherbakoviae TaxID=2094020 RepID=UPI002AA72AC0|nr:ASCH domain-containing protein [Trichococcus shcherbakoviae]